MFFCPFCGSLLLLEPRPTGNQMLCSTCPYAVPLEAGRALTVTHSFRDQNRPLIDDELADAERAAAEATANASGDAGGSSSATAGDEAEFAGAEGGSLITVPCQNDQEDCDSKKATYFQIQMRSADEPPSTFFTCVKCGYRWRQD